MQVTASGLPPRLTEEIFWDDYWRSVELPVEVRWSRDHSHNEILAALERYVPRGKGLRALEIGGAPGQYLAFMHRQHAYDIHLLDYSRVGCEKAKRNFELLGMPVTVHQADLFSPDLDIGQFDLVYSLGFIEHFADLANVMASHVRLARPGGVVVVGCPNFRGVNGWFLRRVAPDLLAKHNTRIMDISTWAEFEKALPLAALFKGYVGGFEPSVFRRMESRSWRTLSLYGVSRVLHQVCRFRPMKRINSPRFSHYVIGAYRVLSK